MRVRSDVPSWCGPAALSAFTELPTSRCIAALREVRGRANASIRRVRCTEIVRAANRLGFNVERRHYERGEKMSLARWLREHVVPEPIIVLVTNHYITVQGRRFVDQRNPLPTPLKGSRYLRRFVQSVVERKS